MSISSLRLLHAGIVSKRRKRLNTSNLFIIIIIIKVFSNQVATPFRTKPYGNIPIGTP